MAYVGRNEAIAQIKAAFKARGLRYSVTGGRGTARGWITIDLLPAVKRTTSEAESRSLYYKMGKDLGIKRTCYSSESIPASSDYYQEYIDRANGRPPSVIGQQYWD